MEDRPPIESFLKSPIQQEDLEPIPTPEAVLKTLKGAKGDKGDIGINGKDGVDGKDGKDGLQGSKGDKGEKGEPGIQGDRGEAGISIEIEDIEAIVLPLIPDVLELAPKELVDKINKAKTAKIKKERVEGLDELEGLARSANRNVQNFISLGGNRSTKVKVNGILYTGVDTLTFTSGVTATPVGDGTELQLAVSGGDGGFTFLTATGTVNGVNQSFTFTQTPTYIVADGAWYQKLDNNSGVNWSGTTSVTMTIPPQSAIWGFV